MARNHRIVEKALVDSDFGFPGIHDPRAVQDILIIGVNRAP